MKNLLGKLANTIAQHYVLGILALLISPAAIIAWVKKINPITVWVLPFFKWDGSGWVTSGVLALAVGILLAKDRVFPNRRLIKNWVADPPTFNASHDNSVFEREYEGVIWRTIVGTDMNPSHTTLSKQAVRVWVYPNPRCPKCGYELERYTKYWYCGACELKYSVPKKLRDHTWEKVRRIFDRYLVQWGHNNFGIDEQPVKPLRVLIEEQKQKTKNAPKVISKNTESNSDLPSTKTEPGS